MGGVFLGRLAVGGRPPGLIEALFSGFIFPI